RSRVNSDADYAGVAYWVLTPYPGTLKWYGMKKANRIVSFDWEKYDQSNVVYKPAQMTGEELRLGHKAAYETFYAVSSIARRFPYRGGRNVLEWSVYNLFMRKGSPIDCKLSVAPPTPEPELAPIPPLLPVQREWRDAVLGAIGTTEDSYSPDHRSAPRRGAAALTKSTTAGTSPGTSGAAGL